MMKFVNVFVERTIVHGAVGPVVEKVFEYKEEKDLRDHLGPRQLRDDWLCEAIFQAEKLDGSLDFGQKDLANLQ